MWRCKIESLAIHFPQLMIISSIKLRELIAFICITRAKHHRERKTSLSINPSESSSILVVDVAMKESRISGKGH